MRFRSTIVLVIVFAMLCAGYAVLSSMNFAVERQEIAARRAFDFEAGAIEWARLVDEDGSVRAEAARAGEGDWAMRQPRSDIAADDVVWERLAGELAGLQVSRELGPATDPAKYGLDKPHLQVVLYAGGGEHSLTFGAMEPLQINRYAQVDGGPVVLINNDVVTKIDQPAHRLRERRVFIVGREGVTRIAFERIWNGRGNPPPGPEPALGSVLGRATVERVGEGDDARWHVVEPEEAPADQQRIQQLLQEVLNASGRGYIDNPESLSDYGLDPAWGNLAITPAGSDTAQTLVLGGADMSEGGEGGMFVKHANSGAVFIIDPYFLNFLPLSPTHFRDPSLLTRPIKGLNRIEYHGPKADFTLVEDAEQGWRMAAPEEAAADQVAVSTLVSNLLEIKAQVFPNDPTKVSGLDHPGLTLTLGFKDSDEPVVLRFARGEGDASFATQDTGDAAVITSEDFDTLVRSADDMRSFELLRFNMNDAIRMTFLYEGETYQLQNLGGTWQISQPPKYRLQNQRDAQAILEAINPVKAEAALPAGESLSSYGLEPPVFSILVYVLDPEAAEGERRVGPLYIGDPVDTDPQHRYATAVGRAGVYLIRQEVLERIREAMRGVRPAGER